MNEVNRGTDECPICGFDKPHTHEMHEVALRHTANDNQRREMRLRAADQYRMATLKEEFDAGPRAYVQKYGSINSTESRMLVIWLLDRIDSGDALAVENVALAAKLRLFELSQIRPAIPGKE